MEPVSRYAADAPAPVRDFLNYMVTVRGRSPQTTHEYYLDLRNFFRYLKGRQDFPNVVFSTLDTELLGEGEMHLSSIDVSGVGLDFIRDITLSDVYDYLAFLAQERPRQRNSSTTKYGLSATSRARKIAAIRSFFKYLTDKATVLEYNPVANLDSPKVQKPLPRYLTTADSLQSLSNVGGQYPERDFCILTLFLNCGMRVSELVGLDLQDIQGDTIRVLGKGNKERTLYLNQASVDALAAYLPHRVQPHDKDKNALFISRNRNRINVQTVKWLVKKHVGEAGLDASKLSPHKLRHTAATLMYQNGVDIRSPQAILGHENLNTTMIYTHVENADLRAGATKNPLSQVKVPSRGKDDETE